MKKWVTILFTFLSIHLSAISFSQEIPVTTEQQLENQTDADQGETEDDTYLLELEHFKKNPLNLNLADADELKQLRIVTDLQVADIDLVKPERVQAVEVGYRSVINNDLSIDISGYFNQYNDFLNQSRVITPYYGTVGTDGTDLEVQKTYLAIANGDRRVYQVYNNSKADVSSMGFGIGLSKKVYKNFELGVNYTYSEFKFNQEDDPSFIPSFNTPKHRIKGTLGNTRLFKNFGFNTNVRWNTEYLWQASFADGMVPENTVLDAQINYAIPSLKSVIKVGANNLFGKDYIQVIGAGAIGQLYFASWTINP